MKGCCCFEHHILIFWLMFEIYSRKMVKIDNIVEDESYLLTPSKEWVRLSLKRGNYGRSKIRNLSVESSSIPLNFDFRAHLPNQLLQLLPLRRKNVVLAYISAWIPKSREDRFCHFAPLRCRHPSASMLFIPTYPHEYLNLEKIGSANWPRSGVGIHHRRCCFSLPFPMNT